MAVRLLLNLCSVVRWPPLYEEFVLTEETALKIVRNTVQANNHADRSGLSSNAPGSPFAILLRRLLTLSKIRSFLVSLSKTSLGDHLIVEIFTSIKLWDRIYWRNCLIFMVVMCGKVCCTNYSARSKYSRYALFTAFCRN